MVVFKEKIRKIKTSITKIIDSIPKPFLGLIFSIIIIISPLINDKISYGHDYIFHATNMQLTHKYIDITKLNLLLPKIFGETIANGFGYGTGIFYPPLSYYLTSYITYFLNLTDTNSYLSISVLEILVVILSGITMYMFLKRAFEDDKIAGIGSISYISSTYFLCVIYTRCALGELLTFIFIPLIFWSLYELFFKDEKKFSLLFVLGYVGMINSHLVLSVYLTIIIIILFLLFPKKVFRKDKLKKIIGSSIIILLISSPFLVPLIEHKILGNYVVFEPYSMYTDYLIAENSISLYEFWTISTKPNDVKIYINLLVLIASIITIVFNKKIFKNKERKVYTITIILILISVFISSSYFPWDKVPDFLKMLQFPWRLRSIIAFGLAILASNIVKVIKGNNKSLIISLLALGILFYGYNTINHNFLEYPMELNDMGMGAQNEYLPVNTKNNFIYYLSRKEDIVLIEGEAKINIIENNTPSLKSEIELASNKIIIELPRLYYLGYEIKLIDNKDDIEIIDYYENENGFIELELNKSGLLEVTYKGTIANKISNYICLITIIICIFTSYIIRKKIKSNLN